MSAKIKILLLIFLVIPMGSFFLMCNPVEMKLQATDSWFTEDADNQILGVVTDLILLKDKTVFAVEGKQRRILMIKDGKIRKTLGRKGEGPREYQTINGIYKIKDALYIVDDRNKKIDKYSLRGDFIETISIKRLRINSPFIILKNSNLLFAASGFRTNYLGFIADLKRKYHL